MFWEYLFLFGTIPVVPIIISASIWDSDLIWPSEDLFDPGSQSDQGAFSSNLALLPSDQVTSFLDPTQASGDSNAFFEDTPPSLFSNADYSFPTSSETGLNGPDLISADVEPISDIVDNIADCSLSNPLSPMSRSRIRRKNDPESCQNPASDVNIPLFNNQGRTDLDKLDEFDELLKDPETRQLLKNAEFNGDHNPYCYLLTGGILPWGVCSSDQRDDTTVLNDVMVFPMFGRFALHTLTHCTLGMYLSLSPLSHLPMKLKFIFSFFQFIFLGGWAEGGVLFSLTWIFKIFSVRLSTILSGRGITPLLLSLLLSSSPFPRTWLCAINRSHYQRSKSGLEIIAWGEKCTEHRVRAKILKLRNRTGTVEQRSHPVGRFRRFGPERLQW